MLNYIILAISFLLTRLILWKFPPNFSDVVYAYYDYARLWSEGYIPYLKHLFEYPPANIPLFYIPWIINRAGIIDYRTFYRLIVVLIDLLVFILIIKTLKKLKVKKAIFNISVFYYIFAIAKAKDFVYDSIDLIFISCLLLSLALLKLRKENKLTRFFSWIFFWLSTAFKYISFPLALPFILMRKKKSFKQEVFLSFFAFLLVWGLPLMIFRTSLSVSFVYFFKRGFQVESVPANIIRLINSWTKTETYIEVFKNYDIVGPVTNKLTPFLSLLFPLTMIGFMIYSIKKSLALSKNIKDEYKEKLKLSLIYIFLFLLTSKVFSTPFHLWLPPLLAVFPYKSVKKQVVILLTSFFMIAISMTPIPNLKFLIFDLHTAIGIARPLCLMFMLYQISKT